MIRHYQVLLLAVPALFSPAFAAPLEFIELTPKTETGKLQGEVLQGDMRSYRVTTNQRTISFVIEGTSSACSLEVRKVPESVASKRFSNFPVSYDEKTKPGDQFTFVFAQSRDAWLKSTPCRFSVKVNGG